MRLRVPHVVVAVASVLAIAALPVRGALAQDQGLVEAPGKAELVGSCTTCHGTEQITAQHRAPEEWAEVVTRMEGFGATVSEAQKTQILAYLDTNYGKGAAAPAAPAAGTPAAPAPAPAPADPAAKPN
jgi:hypothetical protein